MPNPNSCTHIKVNGIRCGSPALRGEQFCYFHQRLLRRVKLPPHSRLHPIALLESEEAIQVSLMEVINALVRNTIDVKRAQLIIRALHIASRNARRAVFRQTDSVREIPNYDAPQTADPVDSEEPSQLDMPPTALPADMQPPPPPRRRPTPAESARRYAEMLAEYNAGSSPSPAAPVPSRPKPASSVRDVGTPPKAAGAAAASQSGSR